MPADRLLGTLLRSLQTYTEQQDSPRLLGTASSLLTTLNNPLNVTLLTSQLLSTPAIWEQPEGLRTCMRCMSVFHSAAQALIRHEIASHNKSPDRDFSQVQLERTLPKDDWIKAVAKGADEHSPRWRHLLVLGGLLLGFGPDEEDNLSRSMRATLEEDLVSAANMALDETMDEDHIGQQCITLVLNHCFPILSDAERSQLDHDRLLPVLMSSTFRTAEGLGSAYFLGAIDLDVHKNPKNLLSWPERAPSYQQVRAMLASPLVSALGPLSRLIGHAVEQVQEPWLVTGVMEDLEDFARTLHLQWRQNQLSEVDTADEQTRLDEEALHSTTPALWRLLRSTMYAAIVILRSAIGRSLGEPVLANDDVAPVIAVRALNVLRNLHFISNRAGSAAFSQYTFVYLTAMDVLSTYPGRAQSFLQDIKPPQLGQIQSLPIDQNLDLFYLNTAEHFALTLTPSAADALLIGPATPYLGAGGDNSLLSVFEAAHSVMLAAFSPPQNSDLTSRHLPSYVSALLQAFPANLSARQFRLAFKTLLQICSPPSPLFEIQPLNPSILLDILHERALHASPLPLQPLVENTSADPTAEDSLPLSEQAILILTIIDTLTQLPLDMLDELLPMAADLVNSIDDESMREHCREHLWLTSIDGGMDPDRSRICHAWWSSQGGREHVLYGRAAGEASVAAMSGALPEEQPTSKL